MSSFSAPQVVFVLVASSSWVAWRFLKHRLFPTILDNVPGPPGASWIAGSLNQLTDPKEWKIHDDIAAQYGGAIRIKGAFGTNALYIFDPKALYHIFVKDQDIYDETDRFWEGNKLMFGGGLFTASGSEHRRQRKMLNPVFSIAHMRQMVPIFYEVAHKVERVLLDKVQKGPQEIDVISWMTRLALELIGQAGLGFSFDELTENSVQHRYAIASKQLASLQTHNEFFAMKIMPRLTRIGTPGFRKLIVDNLPFKGVKDLRDIVNVLYDTSVEIFESKKKAIEGDEDALVNQVGKGKDIISILMKANMRASEDDKLEDKDVLGQISALTFAATDTTSGAICRVLHLLAMDKDSQVKLRDEVRQARKGNGGHDIGYNELVSLPYLDAVCRETLRLFPPVPIAVRTTRRDAVLPLYKPIRGINGEEIREIPIPQGTDLFVSSLGSNRNPDLWGPDAHEWKPERWLNPLPEALIAAHMPGIYSHLMTFIGGSRACIGFKFSQLEMKVVLALLLENLDFSLGAKEIIWKNTGIVSPHVDINSTNPTMPMAVSLAKE